LTNRLRGQAGGAFDSLPVYHGGVSEKLTLTVMKAARSGVVSGMLNTGKECSAKVSEDEAARLIKELAGSGKPSFGKAGPTTEITVDQIIAI
jgi:hypothetical protein